MMFGSKLTPQRRGKARTAGQALALGVLLLVGQVSGMKPAAAQLASCDDALRPTAADERTMTFVLALDRISVLSSVPGFEDPQRLANGLSFKIATNIEALEIDQIAPEANASGVMNTRFRVAPCPQREPRGPGDISDDAELYLNNKVVLELWGSFDGDEAIFSHAILPLYVHGAPPQVQAGDVFTLAHKYQASGAGETLPELRFLKKILLTSLPLRAYAAAGAAAIALEEREYNLARRYYCTARQDMLDFDSERGNLSRQDQRLLDYVEGMSRQVITRAQDDADYDGALGSDLITPGTGCDGPLS